MADDLQSRLMADVQALIAGLDLTASSGATGDVGGNVVVQWERERLNLATLPAAVVSCEGESEGVTNELSNSEQRGTTYPVRVEVVDQGRPDYQAARTDYLAWRHAIIKALHEKTNAHDPPAASPLPVLPNCPECAYTRARPARVAPDEAAQAQVVAALTVECYCVEAR